VPRRALLAIAAAAHLAGCASGPPAVVVGRSLPVFERTDLLYLRERPCPRLVVEVDAVEGCEPTEDAIDAVRDLLEAHCRKPDGIEIRRDPPIARALAEGADECALALRHMSGPGPSSRGPTAFLYMLFYDSKRPAGLAQRPHVSTGHAAAIFVDRAYLRGQVESLALPVLDADDLLPRALTHEVFHVLGLTRRTSGGDNGHCVDASCGMFAKVKLSSARALLRVGLGPTQLCSSCAADLEASRSGPGDARYSFVEPMVVRCEPLYWVLSLPGATYVSLEPPEASDWRALAAAVKGDVESGHVVTGFVADLDSWFNRRAARARVDAALEDPSPIVRSAAQALDEELDGYWFK